MVSTEHFDELADVAWIAGGPDAPERARRHVVAQLGAAGAHPALDDALLVVSELVTNSVCHAGVQAHQFVGLLLEQCGQRLRIVVIDGGSELVPRVLPADRATPGGFGLRLIEQISTAWGVVRERTGGTRVWCELPAVSADGAMPAATG